MAYRATIIKPLSKNKHVASLTAYTAQILQNETSALIVNRATALQTDLETYNTALENYNALVLQLNTTAHIINTVTTDMRLNTRTLDRFMNIFKKLGLLKTH